MLYARLGDDDRGELRAAFMDAMRFYGFRPHLERWGHLGSLAAYLGAIRVRNHKTLEDDAPKPELLLHHALVRHLAELFALGANGGAPERPVHLSRVMNEASEMMTHVT